MIELPVRDPCDLCEVIAGAHPGRIVAQDALTLTVINPWQFETGQCCVITRRHIALLLDLTDEEGVAVIRAAKRLAQALDRAFSPLGIVTFQNNGVYSGQETPHFHLHVVPRQPGSDWGIGPPQLAVFETAGRARGTPHDPAGDAGRRERVRATEAQLADTVRRLRDHLPA